MGLHRRGLIAGLSVVAVVALAFSVEAPRPASRHPSKSEAAVGGIEPGGLGRAAIEPKETREARSASRVRYWLSFLSVLSGLALFLARRYASSFTHGHQPHSWDSGPIWVRGPPARLA
jgi:hypothetical protein